MTIGELLGLAMGCIGLTRDDFCRLTPGEFEEVYKSYREKEESLYKDGWERMRMQTCLVVQPHIKKKLSPKELLPFPWEKKKPKPTKAAPTVSKEEAFNRLEEVLEKEGIG